MADLRSKLGLNRIYEETMRPLRQFPDGIFAPRTSVSGIPDLGQFRNLTFFWFSVVIFLIVFPIILNNLANGRHSVAYVAIGVDAFFGLNILAMLVWGAKPILKALAVIQFVPSLLLVTELLGIVGVLWCFVAIVLFAFMFSSKVGLLCNLGVTALVSALAFYNFSGIEASRSMTTLTIVTLLCFVFATLLEKQHNKLAELIGLDRLTGAQNRVHMESAIDDAIAMCSRYGTASCLILFDIDHFKKLNDQRGHLAGDQALIGFVKTIRRRLRELDKLFRFGGEEFVVVLSETTLDEAQTIADELRQLIERTSLVSQWPVTVSAGITDIREQDSRATALERADKALYRAKDQGRNRVMTES